MTWVAFGAALVFGFGVACVVDLPPDGRYTCTVNTDCGGDDYVCTPAGAGPRFCCKPTGAEVCDGQDNDCNGVVDDVSPDPCYSGPAGTAGVGRCRGGTQACADGGSICAGEVVPTPEVCNTADDNCNGLVDDGFDFRSDPNNCGRCGVGCALPLRCEDGGCSIPTETICNDNIDNDGDNATDCADSDCVGQSCGTGCVCKNFGKSETACNDGQDNDNDTATDCADTDCDGGSCGTGCQCLSGGKIETLCNDTLDNDGDGPADCADSDCNGASCGTGCACAGG
ncbi:MAG TPA: MopE-related protein, partial [Dehalococcoidia bacterium]|nr:MopE-related protein [Dehalococcoidia bacterium]